MKSKQEDYSILGTVIGMLLGTTVVVILDRWGIKSPIQDDIITLTLSIFVFTTLGLIIGMSIRRKSHDETDLVGGSGRESDD